MEPRHLTLDAVRFLDLLGPGDGTLVAMIPDGDVGTSLGEGMGYTETDASAGAGDDCSFSLQRQEGEDLLFGGGDSVVVSEGASFH